ncbi:MAG: 50S ribosomal protein L18 [bacterium]|nr:50S ribosomal protein L18 [bacterium]
MNSKSKQQHRTMRHRRVRARIIGTSKRPRVSVFKSNKHIFVQLIDDETGKTLLSNKEISAKKNKVKGTKNDKSLEIGKMLAEKAKKEGIAEVVFDRGGYKYHGRVKALADGLRAGGLKF